MSKKKKPRQTADYLKTAKTARVFVPSLQKYSRRKSLNRWEKSAITRAQNKVNKASRGGTLIPLSKKQTNALNDRGALVGNGIRAFRARSVNVKEAEISVAKGEIQIKQSGRIWHYEKQAADIDAGLASIEKVFARNKGKTVRLTIWTGAGRLPQTFATVEESLSFFADFFSKYRALSPEFDQWFEGIVYTVDKPKSRGKKSP